MHNKPSTPSTVNPSSSTLTNSVTKGFGLGNQIGTIKRQNSNKPRNDAPSDRPSTAPSKNDIGHYQGSGSKLSSSSAKRLPSPVIKCKWNLLIYNAYFLYSLNSYTLYTSYTWAWSWYNFI